MLAPLDLDSLCDFAFWPAIRRAATGDGIDEVAARPIAEACWRAITTG